MNNTAQVGQGQPGGAPPQQNQQKRTGPPLYRPEQMRALPDAFANEKEKWETGLRNLWNTLNQNQPDTPQHIDAKRKIFEFSKTLTNKMQNYRMQQQQAAQAQAQAQAQQATGGARPQSQGQPSQSQAGEGSGSAQAPTSEQQQQVPQAQKPQISAKVMDHINNFPYILPTQLTAGTPEATKWLQEIKNRYLKGLMAMEQSTARLTAMDAMKQKRNEDNKAFSPEEEKQFKEKKDQLNKAHGEAKHWVDTFRNSQNKAKSQSLNGGSSLNTGQQGNPTQQPTGGNNNTNNGPGAPVPPRPQVNPQQQPPNQALQSTQTVNDAIEAARHQQLAAPRPNIPQNNSSSQATQMSPQNAASQQQTHHPNMKTESQVQGLPPQINTSSSMMQGQRTMQNSPATAHPQSAGGAPMSATSQAAQQPRALTHSAALTQAARSYSSGQTTQGPSQVMGSYPGTQREATNTNTTKMPIPKHLPERATAPPQPVAINPPRPTYSGGPSNMGNGVMSQPVLPKNPAYNMGGEGDRVLSRKKLDELVKQVTGGGHGDGPSLTPEVEESMLTVADTFVDQVLHAACKIAKERGSKTLEIRDIQLTLERGYNIRIPGYASDEIRTVRKIQPSNAWIAKMSAVQAAKVTGGKNQE